MVDNSNLKVTIYAGINDTPEPPTTTEGGNISHFYNLFNQLIVAYDSTINDLTTRIEALEAGNNTATETPYTIPFFVEPPSGTGYIGEAPSMGTLTKYFIDNVNTFMDLNLKLNDTGLPFTTTETSGNGVIYNLPENTTINSGDEITLTYSGLSEELSTDLILYIQE